MIEKEKIDEYKSLRKKYYTIRDLMCGWPVIFSCFKKTKKRSYTATYFVSHVKAVKLFHSKTVIVESTGPIYVSRNWEDAGPRIQLTKLKKEEIKVDLKGIDLDNIVLTEEFEEDLKKFVLEKLENVINSAGEETFEEEDNNNDIF